MAENVPVLMGVIHGKTIELAQEPGLPDGQPVRVVVQPLDPATAQLAPGEGIRLSAGGWSDDPEGLDEYLEWVRQQRKVERFSEES